VSWYQKGKTNLDFTVARDSEWQWHQLGHMPICTLLQTDNHANTPPVSFFATSQHYFVIFKKFCTVFVESFCLCRLAPHNSRLFMVMFGIANGPLALATYIFRNSLVFHDVDKMTSVYIHVLPLFLTYGLVFIAVTSIMIGKSVVMANEQLTIIL